MFAIAKNNYPRQAPHTITYSEWCKKHMNNTNFENKGFMINNIKIKKNINPRFLSQIEIDEICDTPIDFNSDTTSNNMYSHKIAIIPFGVPKNEDAFHFYNIMMENIYHDGPTGKLTDLNITCSVLMSIMRAIVYKMGRANSEPDLIVEKHFVRALLSIYHTMRKYIQRESIIKSLVEGLVDCVSTRDVTQREIACMMMNKDLTDELFDQLLMIAFSRSLKYYTEEYGKGSKYTLSDPKYLKGKFGIFIIVPLLKFSKEYSEKEVDDFAVNLDNLYKKFYDTNIMKKIIDPDNEWQITSEICKVLTNNMIETCKFNIKQKDCDYFKNMLTTISTTNIVDIDDIVCKSKSEIYETIKIPLRPNNKEFTKMAIITKDNENENKLLAKSPRITKWSTFVLDMKNKSNIGLTWENQINARHNSAITPEIRFLGMGDEKSTLNDNKLGMFSPSSEQMTYKHVTTEIINKENFVLLNKSNDSIEIFTETGKIVFKGTKIIVALKNIKLNIDVI